MFKTSGDGFQIYNNSLQSTAQYFSGFSATAFQDRATGDVTVAFRGTEPENPNDILADLIAITGFDEIPQLRLFDQTISIDRFLDQAGLASGGQMHAGVDFTGHSLGGYLSLIASYKYSANFGETHTYNALGTRHWDAIWGELDKLNNGLVLDESRVTNYFADKGIELAASNLFYRPGSMDRVFIEPTQNVIDTSFDNHAISRLVQSLAVYRVLSLLDPGLDNPTGMESIYRILDSSHTDDHSLQYTLQSLNDLLGAGVAPVGGVIDPQVLYAALTPDSGQYDIEPFDSATAAAIAGGTGSAANAYRYALVNFQPFVVDTQTRTTGAADPAYDLLDASGGRQYSDNYLRDRTLMLSLDMQAKLDDSPYPEKSNGVAIYFADSSGREVFAGQSDSGQGGNPTLSRAEVSNILFGDSAANLLDGRDLDDRIYGQQGDDQLVGGAGRDYLEGGHGDDTLIGGAGRDTLVGGAGDDRYQLDAGDGHDIILDTDGLGSLWLNGVEASGGTELGVGVGVWQDPGKTITYTLDANADLHISSGDLEVTVLGHQSGQLGISLVNAVAPPAPQPPLNTIVGQDGQDDLLNGTAGDDTLLGLSGNDTLRGLAGDDWLEGGVGLDRLQGGESDDLLLGGSESDILEAGAGADLLYADLQTDALLIAQQIQASGLRGDWLAGDRGEDQLYGAEGDDVLFGGGETDYLYGGAGSDVLVGDNQIVATSHNWIVELDTPFERLFTPADSSGALENYQAGSSDFLFGGAGADFVSGQLGNDVLHGEAGDDDMVGGAGNDQIYGGDGQDEIVGDYGDYRLEPGFGLASRGDDFIDGGAGDDWLQGGGGADLVFGGTGADTLLGDAAYLLGVEHGDDYLEGEAGDDIAYGFGGADHILGGDDNDTLVGDDVDYRLDAVYHGDDLIEGGAGDDLIAGSGGDDRLYGGDDDDYISGDEAVQGLALESHGNDALFGELGNDVLFGDGGDDYLSGGAGNDYLDGDSPQVTGSFQGADLIEGGAGNDTLHGRGGADRLAGGSGDDALSGGGGADTLDGGEGNDFLQGGSGEDTYLPGAGLDRIEDSDGGSTLVLEAGLLGLQAAGNDLLFVQPGGSTVAMDLASFAGLQSVEVDGAVLGREEYMRLYVASAQSDPLVILDDQVALADLSVLGVNGDLHITYSGSAENWVDADGLLLRGVNAGLLPGPGGGSALVLRDWYALTGDGAAAADYVQQVGNAHFTLDITAAAQSGRSFAGDAAPNILIGTEGGDTLSGGAGFDLLYGQAGDDSYHYARGDGRDRIYDAAGSDHLQFGAGISPAGLEVRETNAGLEVIVARSAEGEVEDSILLMDWLNNTAAHLEQFEFADGTVLDAAAMEALVTGNHAPDIADPLVSPSALPGEPFYYQVPEGAFVDVDAGDFLSYSVAGAGEASLPAWLSFDAESRVLSGNPTVAEAGTVPLVVTATDSFGLRASQALTLTVLEQSGIFGTAGDDVLTGTSGEDFIYGLAGNDQLVAGAGADHVEGGDGSDLLVGGSGADSLHGGAGDDQLFAVAQGNVAPDAGDQLFGDGGDDFLANNWSADARLAGGEGNDRYYLEVGPGAAVTIDNAASDYTATTDTVHWAGVKKNVLDFLADDTDLLIVDGSRDASVRVENWLAGPAFQFDFLELDKGKAISSEQINSSLNGGKGKGKKSSALESPVDGLTFSEWESEVQVIYSQLATAVVEFSNEPIAAIDPAASILLQPEVPAQLLKTGSLQTWV